jgi:hypothetical protein
VRHAQSPTIGLGPNLFSAFRTFFAIPPVFFFWNGVKTKIHSTKQRANEEHHIASDEQRD